MAEPLAPNKRKIINWNKKSGVDSERISKRLEGRAMLEDEATTENDAFPPQPPRIPRASGAPLQRLRKKIKEVYDEDDEDEEYTPFFNINLLNEAEEEKENKNALETVRIAKEQQLAGKLSVIMSSSMAAKAAGLSPHPTAEDARLANSAEFNTKKMRRQTLKQKVEEPLQLKGSLPEKKLSQALKGLNQAQKILPPEMLKDMAADNAPELAEANGEKGLAELILQKSGRKAPKKKLSEIAKGLNQFKKSPKTDDKGKENS